VLLLGGGVLAVIIVAVVAALVLGSGSPHDYPRESPAGALQGYLAALHSGDEAAMTSFLTRRALAQMTAGGGSLPDGSYCGADQERRVRLRSATERGERATLRLEIEQFGGSLLDVSRDTYEREVELAREDGAWKLDEAWLCL
jgi:hypothetical protein